MPCPAQGSRSSLSYIKQTSFGVTPSTPTLATLPINSHSLDLTKGALEGNQIQSDRMPRVFRHGNKQTGGSIEADLCKGDFDELLEAALLSTFSTNVLKVGTTPSYFAMEDTAADITQFRQFDGTTVTGMSLSIAPEQMVQVVFNTIGKNMVQAQSTISTGGGPTASTGNDPFDSYSGTISDGGVSSSDITALEIDVQNNFNPNFVIGSDVPECLSYGRSNVTGTVTVHYVDETFIDKFLDEVESSLSVTVNDPTGTNPYTILLPRVKYNGAAVPLADESARLITLPFVSLYDSSTSTNIQITRTA